MKSAPSTLQSKKPRHQNSNNDNDLVSQLCLPGANLKYLCSWEHPAWGVLLRCAEQQNYLHPLPDLPSPFPLTEGQCILSQAPVSGPAAALPRTSRSPALRATCAPRGRGRVGGCTGLHAGHFSASVAVLLGNTQVVAALAEDRSLHSRRNFFLNLAVADLLVGECGPGAALESGSCARRSPVGVGARGASASRKERAARRAPSAAPCVRRRLLNPAAHPLSPHPGGEVREEPVNCGW
eukprot:bmy_21707T0